MNVRKVVLSWKQTSYVLKTVFFEKQDIAAEIIDEISVQMLESSETFVKTVPLGRVGLFLNKV